MMRFFWGMVTSSIFSITALAADQPVVIGDVAMPEVNSSEAFRQVEKKVENPTSPTLYP